jgi:lysyl-tRNA synthetase class 2
MSDNITPKEQIILDNGLRRKNFWEQVKKNNNISTENSIYTMDFPVVHQIDATKNLMEGDHGSIAGRITKKRTIGAVSFLKIMDHSQEIQLILKEENLNDYKNILDNLFYGDVIGVQGIIGFSNTGERSLVVHNITMISCNYRSVPDKWKGITDPDFCYRNSYMYYVFDGDFQKVINGRWKIMATIRKFFQQHDFLEVETPVLQTIPSGAAAKPFKTHHNALDMEMYLRIAPELYLKMMVAAGYNRVFEMGKIFRNEGIDPTHLQEFTMLECYTAYADVNFYIDFTRNLLLTIKEDLAIGDSIHYRGHEIFFNQPWPVISFSQLLKEKLGIEINNNPNLRQDVINMIQSRGEDLNLEAINSSMGLIDYIYKKLVRPSLIQPTFVTNYPTYMAPLASVHNGASTKMQLVVAGVELTNCYGELVDPFQQEENFKIQDEQQKSIDDDEDIFRRDNDYLSAMKFGMVPMAGFGMGIDRIISFFTGQDNLKNTLMFPINK